jgi:magnesium transporter
MTPSPTLPSEATAAVRVLAVGPGGASRRLDGTDGLEALVADASLRLWIDITDPDPASLDRVSAVLGIHPLVIEDIGEQNQRAKIERLDGSLHLVLFALAYEGEVSEAEIDFVLAERYLLTAHDARWDPLRAPQLRGEPERILASGPDYLLYAFADWIVDDYFPVLDRLTDEIDALQDEVIERRSEWTLQRLFVLKRELIRLRRATTPAREILNQMTNRELGMVQAAHVIYYRDVYDHLIRVTDELDTYRELVSGTLDVYLTSVNNELSNIMKRLTGVTVILAGVGAVAGLFGMSEAGIAFTGGEAFGFWAVLGGTVIAAAVVAVVLRRIDWI